MLQHSVLLAAVLCFHGLGELRLHGADPESAEQPIAQFEVAKDGDFLLLPVTVSGTRYSFVLDTGCDVMFYDRSFGELLGESVGEARLNGTQIVAMHNSPAAMLGEISLQTESPVIALDLQRLREFSALDIRGIIGMSALRSHAMRIDFDQGRLTVLNRADPSCGEPVDLWFDRGGLPQVVGVLPEVGIDRLVIDTGKNGSLSISDGLFDTLQRAMRICSVRRTVALGISDKRTASSGMLDSLKVGPFEHGPLPVSSSGENLLGLGFLSRFVVTLDFPNKVMYLKPGRSHARRELRGLSGLSFVRRNGTTIVFTVDEDSPASDSHVVPGDTVISVDGKPAGEYSFFELRRLLSIPGARVELVLAREGETLSRTLQLPPEDESDRDDVRQAAQPDK